MPLSTALDSSHISYFNVRIDGQQVRRAVLDALLDCTVENSLHLPDACTLRLHDSEFRWLDSDLFKEGNSVLVEGGLEKSESGAGEMKTLFEGEITALEMDLAAQGVPTVAVRCLDRSHRLHRGRLARSFMNTKDSDIVRKIGAECGFQVKAETTSDVHDWIFQNNQTNWEFLQERAFRNGFWLYVRGEKELRFEKVKDTAPAETTLIWGRELRSFRPRVSASPQVDEVIVRGWDAGRKQAIIGKCSRASGSPQVGQSRTGSEVAHEAFGAAKMVVVDRPVQTQTEANDLARSFFDSVSSGYLQAEGLCYGMPHLKPGHQVVIENIGTRFSGKYTLTAATHTYNPSEGFSTLFSVSGKNANTLLSLVEDSDMKASRLGGNIVVAVVADNNDPQKMGRVKVRYPWLTEEHTSFWARTASQMAGRGRGFFNLPEIDDEVLVAFEHGDIHRPYIIGMLWNGKDGLPGTPSAVLGTGGVVDRRGYHTRIGHKLDFNDAGGKGDITLTTAGKHTVALDDANQKISLVTTGKHQIILDDAGKSVKIITPGGQQVLLEDNGAKITLTDTAGDTLMLSSGSILMSAKQTISLSAPTINVTGAQMTNITGGLYLGLQGGAVLNASGAAVKINGGYVRIDGKQVDIN